MVSALRKSQGGGFGLYHPFCITDSTNSLFMTNLNSISPYSSLSMHIDLMTSLNALNQGTVLKMLTEKYTLDEYSTSQLGSKV